MGLALIVDDYEDQRQVLMRISLIYEYSFEAADALRGAFCEDAGTVCSESTALLSVRLSFNVDVRTLGWA